MSKQRYTPYIQSVISSVFQRTVVVVLQVNQIQSRQKKNVLELSRISTRPCNLTLVPNPDGT